MRKEVSGTPGSLPYLNQTMHVGTVVVATVDWPADQLLFFSHILVLKILSIKFGFIIHVGSSKKFKEWVRVQFRLSEATTDFEVDTYCFRSNFVQVSSTFLRAKQNKHAPGKHCDDGHLTKMNENLRITEEYMPRPSTYFISISNMYTHWNIVNSSRCM